MLSRQGSRFATSPAPPIHTCHIVSATGLNWQYQRIKDTRKIWNFNKNLRLTHLHRSINLLFIYLLFKKLIILRYMQIIITFSLQSKIVICSD